MKRIFAALLAMMLAAALFTACGPAEDETTHAPRTTMAGSASEATAAPEALGELGPLTKEIFAVYTAGGTYHVKYVGPMAGGGESTDEVYAKGGSLAMMWPDDPDYNRAVIKDDWCTLVNDDQKTAKKIPLEELAGYPIPPDLAAMRFVGSGRAEFRGEELDYDEYYYANGLRPENDFQAFYFVKDGKLKGFRHAWEGGSTEVEYLVFEAEAPDSVFDIPADYIVTEN